MSLTVSVIGAGGKMGTRVTTNLAKHDHYDLLFCEKSELGIQSIKERGYEVTDTDEAVKKSDVVILAVPDVLLGKISSDVVSMMKSGAVLLTLDPAAAYSNELKLRNELTYVVAHPCHPSVFVEKFTREEHEDAFGGVAAKQDIVAALFYGEEDKYSIGEQVAIDMYAPVETCHRITVEQMAILEPTAAEVVACTTAVILKETLDEVVKMGVPEPAARAFLLGHIQIGLAVAFRGTNPFSDACQIAIDYGKEMIFKPDWKDVFEKEELDKVLKKMLQQA
ncbi:phosphogluconate dehydrogenase C-terminal domain-containing protein [Bacillus sp. es.034]|uniref:phosphogluconate dehydrogenase C-terminal domain-containing protein n=1 Tax=Bacillus sp. es.034 TaxID=1761763 RepID=UPI000BF7E961|nr:phosphogluconate dehydrogenase C-terminal domain-containing protein [Bacillus sp. es.034]PFG03348.1 acetohydroxy acid isomeroreductase-like protein [Bacillus sp. es.034]